MLHFTFYSTHSAVTGTTVHYKQNKSRRDEGGEGHSNIDRYIFTSYQQEPFALHGHYINSLRAHTLKAIGEPSNDFALSYELDLFAGVHLLSMAWRSLALAPRSHDFLVAAL